MSSWHVTVGLPFGRAVAGRLPSMSLWPAVGLEPVDASAEQLLDRAWRLSAGLAGDQWVQQRPSSGSEVAPVIAALTPVGDSRAMG